VWLDPYIGQAGDGPSVIVQAPRFHDAGEATIEIELAAAPGRKTGTAAIAEWSSRLVRGTEGDDQKTAEAMNRPAGS
jgi:hypothetical protein